VIVISRIDGKIRDAWVTDHPTHDDLKYAEPNETIEKRLWEHINGTALNYCNSELSRFIFPRRN
jgi:hypothetical protein